MPKQYLIGNRVKVGGELGENPALLVGSVFYEGDPLIKDADAGLLNLAKAKELILSAKELVEGYGLQFAVDYIIPSRRAVDPVAELISEAGVTAFVDSPDPRAKADAYIALKDLGVGKIAVANGIDTSTSNDELKALRDSGIGAAVLLAFDPANPSESMRPENRLKILQEVLLPKANEAGIEAVLADAVVLDPASIAISAEAIRLIRDKLSIPAGCAPANALGPVSKKRLGVEEAVGIHSGIATYLRVSGADFIFYGPVKRARYVAAAVAAADSMLGYALRRKGVRIDQNHPVRKALRKLQKLFTGT